MNKASIAGIILDVKIDRSEPLELHEQVAAELRRAIAEREARPGERLPPARDLAAVLGVNRNTVLRALRLLRDERLLEFHRGRAATVAKTSPSAAVTAKASELVRFARRQGYGRQELVELIRELSE
jgi:GntR family transcriptional regulator